MKPPFFLQGLQKQLKLRIGKKGEAGISSRRKWPPLEISAKPQIQTDAPENSSLKWDREDPLPAYTSMNF